MNINSGIILGKKGQVIVSEGGSLLLLKPQGRPQSLKTSSAQFLTGCPYGKCFAFWEESDESFHLMDVTGRVLWSQRINTDKNGPGGILFSPSGDAVAFIDSGEYGEHLCVCDFKKGYVTSFRSCSPIGYDPDLLHFVEAPLVPPLWDCKDFTLFEYDEKVGNYAKVPREVFIRRMAERLTVINRHKKVLTYAPMLFHDWDCLAIQNSGRSFVLLRKCALVWFSVDSSEPESTMNNCVPPRFGESGWGQFILNVFNDIVLIQSSDFGRARLVDRRAGIVWEANNLLSAMLRGQRAIAHYADGTVEVIEGNGSVETRYMPPSGFKTVAADALDNVLSIAYMSEKNQTIELKAYALG